MNPYDTKKFTLGLLNFLFHAIFEKSFLNEEINRYDE
jgi:hypothetical protein